MDSGQSEGAARGLCLRFHHCPLYHCPLFTSIPVVVTNP